MKKIIAYCKANGLVLAKCVAPAVLTILATSIHPAMAADAASFQAPTENPIAKMLGGIQTNLVLPIVEKLIGVAAVGTLGFMAFDPNKERMIQKLAGVGLAGGLGVGSVYILDHFVFAEGPSATGALF